MQVLRFYSLFHQSFLLFVYKIICYVFLCSTYIGIRIQSLRWIVTVFFEMTLIELEYAASADASMPSPSPYLCQLTNLPLTMFVIVIPLHESCRFGFFRRSQLMCKRHFS